MPEQFNERELSQLRDPNFLKEIQNALADKMDDLATDPQLKGGGFSLDNGEKIRRGEKIPSSRMIIDAVAAVGQDFRLTHDEINELKNKFLK